MTEIFLIRHGMTRGNKAQRYIGRTDESLCPEGREALEKLVYPDPEVLYVSPLLRCRETAELLFPGKEMRIVDHLAECDFGDFENKNYQELSGNREYQAWIDSGGSLPFPNGESREHFRNRNLEGFAGIVAECIRQEKKSAALVVHGGTIMNIMEAYGTPKRKFYDWHVKNGRGYQVCFDSLMWEKNCKILELKKEW